MGIFDKAENEAEDMAQKDPNLAQQADQMGGGQLGQDMQTAQSMVGQQGGSQEQGGFGQSQDQGQGQDQGGYQDQNMDSNQNMDSSQQGGYDQNQDPSQQGGSQDQGQGGYQDQNMDSDQNMDPNQRRLRPEPELEPALVATASFRRPAACCRALLYHPRPGFPARFGQHSVLGRALALFSGRDRAVDQHR